MTEEHNNKLIIKNISVIKSLHEKIQLLFLSKKQIYLYNYTACTLKNKSWEIQGRN